MRFRTLKRTALALVLLLMVLLVAAGLYSENILRMVLEREFAARVVPVLRVDGPVQLRFHPELVLTVHGLVLNDREGDALLVIPETRLTFDRDALFRGQVVLDAVLVTGLDLRLRRDDEALWRRDGWLHPVDQPVQGGIPLVGQVSVRDATIRVEDDASWRVSGLQLEAGPLAFDESGMFALEMTLEHEVSDLVSQGRVTLTGGFVLAEHGLVANDLTMGFEGSTGRYESISGDVMMRRIDVSGGAEQQFHDVVLDLTVVDAQDGIDARASIEALRRVGATWEAVNARLDAQVRVDDWRLSGQFSAPRVLLRPGSLEVPSIALVSAAGGPMSASLDALAGLALDINDVAREISVSVTHGQLGLPHPAGGELPLDIDFRGDALWSLVSGSGAGQISGGFDQSRFDGHWRHAMAESPPLSLSLALDRLDLDDYMPPPAQDAAPADLTMWRNWPVEAELSVGELRLQGFVTRDARLSLRGP